MSLSTGLSYTSQVVERVQLGTQTTVDTQELLVHNSSQGKAAEGLHAGFVHGLGILVLALQLEGEVVSQVATLVVASQQPQCLGVVNLERPQVENAFDAKVSSIDVVAEEEISRLGRVASDLEQLHQVVVLAVNVAADGNRGVHLEEVGLGTQKLGTLLNDPQRLLLGKPALAVEVLLEKVDVGLFLLVVFEKLLVRRLEHGRRLDICRRAMP